MPQTRETCVESLRIGARTAKAIAVQKYRAGDLSGAKEFAQKAKELNPVLTGLHRLNAVLYLLLGFEKKLNGEVDWYAVLSVDPTADTAKIVRRYRKLLLCIVMDDGDDSVGSIEKAKILLANSWRFLCVENNRKLYDKLREERADLAEQQEQLKRASEGPSFTCTPVVLSAANPPQRVSEENEGMVQPSVGGLVQVPVTLSPSPSQGPKMINGEKERVIDVMVRQHSLLLSRTSVDDLRKATEVPSSSSNSAAPEPVVKSEKLKMFNEEDEELVEVSVEEFGQALLPSSSRGGENKRKAPMCLLPANQLRRMSQDAGIKSIEGRGDNVGPSVTKPSLEGYVSASQYVSVNSSSAPKAPQESNKYDAASASQYISVASSFVTKAPQESNNCNAANIVNTGSKNIFYMNKQPNEQVSEIIPEKMD